MGPGVPSHQTSRKRADGFVQGSEHFLVVDKIPSIQSEHENFLFDLKIVSPLTALSTWKDRTDAADLDEGFLAKAQNAKYTKHEHAYARLSYGFLAFTASSFCVMGPTLLKFLSALSVHKTMRDPFLRSRLNLPDLDPKWIQPARAKYLSNLFAQVTDALAKAALMRINGVDFAPAVTRSYPRSLPLHADSYSQVLSAGGPPPSSSTTLSSFPSSAPATGSSPHPRVASPSASSSSDPFAAPSSSSGGPGLGSSLSPSSRVPLVFLST